MLASSLHRISSCSFVSKQHGIKDNNINNNLKMELHFSLDCISKMSSLLKSIKMSTLFLMKASENEKKEVKVVKAE